MSARLNQLTIRRRDLLSRCTQQRGQLQQASQQIELQLGQIDRAVDFVRGVLRSPAVIVCGVTAVVLLGPQRLSRWITRGVALYSVARRLQRFASVLRPPVQR